MSALTEEETSWGKDRAGPGSAPAARGKYYGCPAGQRRCGEKEGAGTQRAGAPPCQKEGWAEVSAVILNGHKSHDGC